MTLTLRPSAGLHGYKYHHPCDGWRSAWASGWLKHTWLYRVWLHDSLDVISHSCKCHRMSSLLAVGRISIPSAGPRRGFECKCIECRHFDLSGSKFYIKVQERSRATQGLKCESGCFPTTVFQVPHHAKFDFVETTAGSVPSTCLIFNLMYAIGFRLKNVGTCVILPLWQYLLYSALATSTQMTYKYRIFSYLFIFFYNFLLLLFGFLSCDLNEMLFGCRGF